MGWFGCGGLIGGCEGDFWCCGCFSMRLRERWPLQPPREGPCTVPELPRHYSDPLGQQFSGLAAHRYYGTEIMARPDALNPITAVFETCKTAESRTSEVLASVLEILEELKADGVELPLTQAARICADASRQGSDSFWALCLRTYVRQLIEYRGLAHASRGIRNRQSLSRHLFASLQGSRARPSLSAFDWQFLC